MVTAVMRHSVLSSLVPEAGFAGREGTPPWIAYLAGAKRAVAGLLWRCRLIALSGWIRRAVRGPRLIVLCYHRVDADASHPAFSASPREFARHLEWFSSRFRILDLAGVAAYLSGTLRLTGDALVLTFDDGYADNRHIVMPLLVRRGLPAAFFLATGPLLERSAYWYHALWDGLGRERDRGTRRSALNAYKDLPRAAREGLLERIHPDRRSAPTCETMTVEEARECALAGIEIGGHTRSHPSLARVPAEECEAEIRAGVDDLRREGFTVRAFAYPFGESMDTGGIEGLPRRVVSAIPDLELAFTTEERAVSAGDDPFLVPRKVITPQSLPQIALRLEILSWRR